MTGPVGGRAMGDGRRREDERAVGDSIEERGGTLQHVTIAVKL